MTRRPGLIIGITCVILCVLCGAISIWSVFQADPTSIDVQIGEIVLLPHEIMIRYANGLPMVDCLVNETPAVGMINTGASSALMDEAKLNQRNITKGSRSHSANVPSGVYSIGGVPEGLRTVTASSTKTGYTSASQQGPQIDSHQ